MTFIRVHFVLSFLKLFLSVAPITLPAHQASAELSFASTLSCVTWRGIPKCMERLEFIMAQRDVELNADGCLGLSFETQGKKSYAHLTSHSKHSTSHAPR